MMPLIPGAIYEHVKTGGRYRLLGVGKSADSLEEFVIYEALYDNPVSKLWIRPIADFVGEAKSPDGTFHPRFKLITEK